MTMATGSSGLRGAVLAAVIALAGIGGTAAWAQNADTVIKVPENVLSVSEIESRLTAQGIKVKEIKVRDLLAKVEGYDANGREIEVVVDRRTGEMLSHEYDD